MEIVKSMLGGLIGGAVGAVVANMIQSIAGVSSPWFLLITGLGTGLGVRAAAGVNRNFVTGIVGAVTTVVVLLGSSVATSLAEVSASPDAIEIAEIEVDDDPSLDQASDADDAAAESADGEAEDSEDAESENAASSDTESDDASEPGEDPDAVESLDEDAARAATAAASAASAGITADGPITDEAALEQLERQSGWSVMDFLFNGVSALLAFALSSGSGSSASRSEPTSKRQI